MKLLQKDRLLNSAPILVVLVVALILPFVLQPFWVERITGWIPIAVGALGLNLLTGYNGQISVGHGALYGLGAYAGAMLVADGHWPLLLAIVGAGAVCFVAGALIGLPALRIRGARVARPGRGPVEVPRVPGYRRGVFRSGAQPHQVAVR